MRLRRDVGTWIDSDVSLLDIRIGPIPPTIAMDSVRLPAVFRADSVDRRIIATARPRGARLLTADRAILDYARGGHMAVIDASC